MYFKPTTWTSKVANITLSNGDLTATQTVTGIGSIGSVSGVSSGKWYWEINVDLMGANQVIQVGVGDGGVGLTENWIGGFSGGYVYFAVNGVKMNNNMQTSYGSTYITNDIISVALDMDAGKIWWAKNGVWIASGDPENGTNEAFSGLSGTFYAMATLYNVDDAVTANFGASALTYSVPNGFNVGLGYFFEENDGYTGKVYYHNINLETRTDYPVKLTLNENNFNFDLAQSNGFGFRLAERSNGSGIFKMWVAHWDKDNKYAVLWFKIPYLSADSKSTFYAFWGGDYSDDISTPEELNFLFYEDFKSIPLDQTKWTGKIDSGITFYGCLFPSGLYFTTTTNPLSGQLSWIIEAGVYLAVDTSCDLSDRAHGFEFIGDENDFTINIMHESRVEHSATYPGGSTYQNIDQTYGGLEFDSYQEHYIAYYEPEDKIYQRISNRKSYADIENKIDRKVEGDTRPSNVRLHGRQTDSTNDGAYPSYISWLVIREYDVLGAINLDGGELYIPYENVDHQILDYKEYTEDLTSIDYFHTSSFGGDASKLSNDNISDIWYSDEDAALQDQVYVTIYFDRAETLVSDGKFHYDSSHETFYGASKMSDSDSDVHDRDHWRSEALNAWAIINFYNDRPIVNVFGIKAVSDDLDSCPKNYKFYGGLEPYHSSFRLLHEGSFTKTTEWQSVTFVNKNPYKYYKFEVIDSYGNDIKVQEWAMYEYIGFDKPKYISQVRLLPADFGGLEDNFPKEISLEGSNDMLNWETVMPWINTYTPYISHNILYGKWQRYSFTNIKGYWHYRLVCKGNWGATDGRIVIGEWEMCELREEENIHRILSGDTNIIKQIWASDTCGFEDIYGLIYIANEKLNIVQGSKLVEEKEISEFYDDINVV